MITKAELLQKPSELVKDESEGWGIAKALWAWLKKYNREAVSYKGIGLSACQVGIFKQVCLINLPYSKFYLANPVIIAHSDQQITNTESCLSLPGVVVKVPRYLWIEVSSINFRESRIYGLHPLAKNYTDLNKNLLETIVIQHEYDHILGKLITNYQNENG